MPSQVREAPRKRPIQGRARATVDAILLASAHILKTEGIDRATTNRIARLAGVSIGSLYQYFPNKHAVVAAVRERQAEWFDRSVEQEATRRVTSSLRDAVLPAIERLIAMHRADPALHRALAQGERALDAHGDASYRRLLQQFLEDHAETLRPLDPELASAIAVRALEAVIHGTALDEPERLDDPAFAREVTELFVRYIEP